MSLTIEQAQTIWNHFSDGTIRECTRLGGLSSENFLLVVASGERFVLKVATTSYLHDFEQILASYLYWHKHGIPAIVPLLGKNHAYLQTGGTSTYVLFPFVDGLMYHQDTLTEAALKSAGMLLGRIHSLPFEGWHGGNQYLSEQAQKRSQLSDMDLSHCAEKELIKESIQLKADLKKTLHIRLIGKKDLVFVHGDFHNSNIIFGPDDQVAALLDLEQTMVADAGKDYVKFIDLGCCNTKFEDHNFHMAKIFLNAYRSIRPLSHEDFRESLFQYLLAMTESSFFESAIALDGKIDLVPYLERDLKKYRFYIKHLDSFIDTVW